MEEGVVMWESCTTSQATPGSSALKVGQAPRERTEPLGQCTSTTSSPSRRGNWSSTTREDQGYVSGVSQMSGGTSQALFCFLFFLKNNCHQYNSTCLCYPKLYEFYITGKGLYLYNQIIYVLYESLLFIILPCICLHKSFLFIIKSYYSKQKLTDLLQNKIPK